MFRNHKKLWIIVLIVVVVGVGAAMSQKDKEKDVKPITNADSQSQTGNNTAPGENTPQATSDSGSKGKVKESITEQVLFEEDGVKVTAKEYVNDELIWGDGIKLLIENNSTKDVRVGCDALIVNNYMISDLFSSTVAVGKKANETLHLSSSDLEAAGIDVVGQIEIYFYISDASSYMIEKRLDPVTIKTSEYANMDTTPNDAGKELLNRDGIRVVGKYVDENSFWGAGILLYIENKSGKKITITCDDVSINGFMVTTLFSSTVYDQKMAIDDITLLSSDLEKNGITSVDEVELKFRVRDKDTFGVLFETDPIKFSTK